MFCRNTFSQLVKTLWPKNLKKFNTLTILDFFEKINWGKKNTFTITILPVYRATLADGTYWPVGGYLGYPLYYNTSNTHTNWKPIDNNRYARHLWLSQSHSDVIRGMAKYRQNVINFKRWHRTNIKIIPYRWSGSLKNMITESLPGKCHLSKRIKKRQHISISVAVFV